MLAILESSFDGIFITDHQACPIWCNHSYEIISGLTAQDVLGVPMDQLVRRGIISDSSTLKALSQNQPVTVDQTFKTGKRVLVTSTPIYDQNNQVCLVVSNVRDITEIIALQETLDHQRRLSARYQQEIAVIRDQLLHTPQMVAEDPSTLNLLRIVGRAAQLDTVVLIQGKPAPAKSASPPTSIRAPRARKNFIRVNCGAIPENLAESELFGYERGPSPAPTGRAKPASSRWPTRAPFSSTRWASSPWPPKPSFSGSSRKRRSPGWGAADPPKSTSGSSPPPTGTCKNAWPRAPSGRTSITA